MFETKTTADPMLQQVEQLREFNKRSWGDETDADINLYLSGDDDKFELDEAEMTNVSSTSSSAKPPLEIEILDPANEKKFEELAARDDKLKTYKRKHSGDLDTPTKREKEAQASADDEDQEEEEDAKDSKGRRPRYWMKDRKRVPSESSETTSASSSTTKTGGSKVEIETDPEVLSRRQKQIDFGKNTVGYDEYRKKVPRFKREPGHPRTPPMNVKYSRRAFDGLVKVWRKQLHEWDAEENKAE